MPDRTNDELNNGDLAEDRPLECSECRKKLAVRYTEVIGNTITHTVMCADCPQLQRRLHGIPARLGEQAAEGPASVTCGNCGTTLEGIRMGNFLGCSVCYDVFDEVILSELVSTNRVSPRITTTKKSMPIHVGRIPGESKEINPALRLLALNDALAETLRREDYEQAALLRDQIKELTERSDGKE